VTSKNHGYFKGVVLHEARVRRPTKRKETWLLDVFQNVAIVLLKLLDEMRGAVRFDGAGIEVMWRKCASGYNTWIWKLAGSFTVQ